ncbi:MAG: V-type ATPase subunit [Treponema sp.]|nr:V-type ATPase subunit [Treponema sp.]
MWEDSGYAYAKAGWLVGKSWLGQRASILTSPRTLTELDRLIFPDNYRELPGRELLPSLEKRIIARSVRQILSVVNSYSNPPKLLIRMLKGFEYGDLKECLAHIAGGNNSLPVISDIGRFKTIRFNAFPDVSAMIKKTEFESLLSGDIKSIKAGMDLTDIDAKLDWRFYQSLIESLSQLDQEDRETAARIVADEVSLRSCLWALRLRSYYNKSEAETRKYLFDFKLPGFIRQNKTSLSYEAKQSLEFSLDFRENWRGWRWEKFLNQEQASVHWKADPRYFQNSASRHLYHLSYRGFHSSPMSVSAIFCFIKLKQFEEDLLTSVAEGLALGMESAAVFKMLPLQTGAEVC